MCVTLKSLSWNTIRHELHAFRANEDTSLNRHAVSCAFVGLRVAALHATPVADSAYLCTEPRADIPFLLEQISANGDAAPPASCIVRAAFHLLPARALIRPVRHLFSDSSLERPEPRRTSAGEHHLANGVDLGRKPRSCPAKAMLVPRAIRAA